MEFVFTVPSDRQGALKKVLDEEPLAKDSFASAGFVLKESAAVGLQAGKYAVYFKADDAQLAAKLKERIGKVEGGAEEISGSEKEKVISAIHAEQDEAAAGFGSIFG